VTKPAHGHRRCRLRALTLVELLVVVAILSVLLAVMIPSLRQARIMAHGVVCQSNLRQLAFGWHEYLDDHHERFYQGINANLEYGGWEGMVQASPRPLNPYLGLAADLKAAEGAEVFCCPADTGGVPGYAQQEKAFRYLGTSYQTNILLIGQDAIAFWDQRCQALHEKINVQLKDLTVNRICAPSKLLLLGDYGWVNEWMTYAKRRTEWHHRDCHHNLAFMDGHVEFLRIRKGQYVTDDYYVLPFGELHGLARQVQEELP